jgi:hypothetical protein
MTELSLKKSGRRLEDHYDVVADGAVVGRITLFTTTPAELPWVWTIAPWARERSNANPRSRCNPRSCLGGVCQELAPEMSECLSLLATFKVTEN